MCGIVGYIGKRRVVPVLLEGLKKLETELKKLRSVDRPANVKAIEEAREHGDLKENAEYHAAKEKQGLCEARIAEIEDKLSRAEVIDPSTLSGDKVKFGAIVELDQREDQPLEVLANGRVVARGEVVVVGFGSGDQLRYKAVGEPLVQATGIEATAEGSLADIYPEVRDNQVALCIALVTGPGGPDGQKGYPWSCTKGEPVEIDFNYMNNHWAR